MSWGTSLHTDTTGPIATLLQLQVRELGGKLVGLDWAGWASCEALVTAGRSK